MPEYLARLMDRLFAGPNRWLTTALGAAMLLLISAAVVGSRDLTTVRAPDATTIPDRTVRAPEWTPGTLDADADDTTDPETGVDSTTRGNARVGGEESPAQPDGTGGRPPGPAPSEPGATREGIQGDHFVIGVHAPLTLNGAPLNIADHFIVGVKGYITQLNRQGGIHGRMFRMVLVDDEYTTAGGRRARDALMEAKPFAIVGTLGVDQIHIVAEAAKRAGIPYMASGGPENEWRDLGMFQMSSSYDQWMEMLVRYLCSPHGEEYVGGEIRLGTTALNSDYMIPVERRFVQKLEQRGCIAPIDPNARVTVRKPDEQTTYRDQLIRLSGAYEGQGANLLVPLQDPITTSRQVQELRTFTNYNPKWTFSSFVHDAETTLALMGGEWNGVRGLSGGCYYLSEHAGNPSLCAQMHAAHNVWVNLGQVSYDTNAGGCAGGRCNYNYNQSSWQDHGQGGSAGYQLVHFVRGAMEAIGDDPTREKFVEALWNFENYADLVTAPITFRGSDNAMRGALGAVVLQGQANNTYRQLTDITPGIVQDF